MLLKLIPEPNLPTVLFNFSFRNLPEGVPVPQNWTTQLQHLFQENLEMPEVIHALDRSAWACCLVSAVVFHAAPRVVECEFVDGSCLQWPMLDDGLCLRELQTVTDDVNESTALDEADMERARQAAMPAPSRSTSPVKATKHKKSRSLLMTIILSLVPSLPSSPTIPERETSLSTPAPAIPNFHPSRQSRSLRRRAREKLVDIFRRFVIPTLGSPFSAGGNGGYSFWIAQSMLRRIDARMQELVAAAGGPQAFQRGHGRPALALRISPSALSESPFEDDAESGPEREHTPSETGTDSTDGSSVHTPQDSEDSLFAEQQTRVVMCRTTSSEDALINAENGMAVPCSPSPINSLHKLGNEAETKVGGNGNSELFEEYAALQATTLRLRALLNRTEAAEQIASAERATQLRVLEAKSRRRAWSNHALMGRAEVAHAGLSAPSPSSPLVRFASITPETLKEEQARLAAVPRTPGGRLTARRLTTIREGAEACVPRDVEVEGCESVELHVPPPAYSDIPFPQTVVDFCSTGPQDTLPLFAHPSEYGYDDADSAVAPSSYSPYATYSTHSMRDDMFAEAFPGRDSGLQDPPAVPIHVYGDGFDLTDDQGCEEFTLALDLKSLPNPHVRRHRRMARSEWMSEPLFSHR